MAHQLKQSLPPDRSYEQIENHYLVERAIAKRLKMANRAERINIYASMYDELFRKVPDHPRLTRRNSDVLTAKSNKNKYTLIRRSIGKDTVFMEFAPGDCRFSMEMTRHVKFVYGIDISDQRSQMGEMPDNFKLIIYDGYNLPGIINESIDLVFSDQLIEHFHPEDTKLHFELVYSLLKKGGRYIFHTPHNLTGPSDVSRYFSDEPECFHLKEWSYTELKILLKKVGYSDISSYIKIKNNIYKMPHLYFDFWERVLSLFPKPKIRKVAQQIIRTILIVARK